MLDLKEIRRRLEEILVLQNNLVITIENLKNDVEAIETNTNKNFRSIKEVLDILELDYDVEELEKKDRGVIK